MIKITYKINGRVCLSNLRSISHREFNTACGIYEKIRKIKESRISYVQEHGLEPLKVLVNVFSDKKRSSRVRLEALDATGISISARQRGHLRHQEINLATQPLLSVMRDKNEEINTREKALEVLGKSADISVL